MNYEEDNNMDGSVGVIGVKCVDAGYNDRGVQCNSSDCDELYLQEKV